MLIPKRTKYRKQHRPVRRGMSKGGNEIAFGDFGIQALAPAYVTNRQVEAAPGSSADQEAARHPNGFR